MSGGAETNPLAAACYADRAGQHQTTVLENVQLATDTYRIRLACPELARVILPGQFLMIRIPSSDDPLLGPTVRAVRHRSRRSRAARGG